MLGGVHMIRKVKADDVGRIAEIIVYNNRQNFYPIFKNVQYSFKELNVLSLAKQLVNDKDFLSNTFVFDDDVIKGFIWVINQEVKKLYVDTFFQNEGIGRQLLQFAIEKLNANHLWALEKNESALRFYGRYGFQPDGEKTYEEGTTEFLIHLTRLT